MKKWDILNSAYLLRSKWLTVRKDHVKTSKGVELNDFYVLEYPNWINVIAITTDGAFVIEEQYRHGIQTVNYELCAGVCEKNESPMDAAKRELLEETGFGGGVWQPYGIYAPNVGSMNNKCYSFIAEGVYRMNQPTPEPTEDIAVHLFTLSKIKELLLSDKIIESVMQAPLWRYIAEHPAEL